MLVQHLRKVIISDGQMTIYATDGSTLTQPFERVRHENDVRLVVGEPTSTRHNRPKPDPQLIILLQDAHRARALALAKPRLSIEQLATTFGHSTKRYKRLFRLSYLSPAILTAIVEKRQPERLTNRFLQHLNGLPTLWSEQELLLLC